MFGVNLEGPPRSSLPLGAALDFAQGRILKVILVDISPDSADELEIPRVRLGILRENRLVLTSGFVPRLPLSSCSSSMGKRAEEVTLKHEAISCLLRRSDSLKSWIMRKFKVTRRMQGPMRIMISIKTTM
eukprot:snap_masked-scaffold274_size229011-processed-gene-1.9 protein:Tk02573 transcript:snap_masked-scaffold274_size229011-processed-gene-1.9-mRNA-1 annotation:"---NA---"